MEVASWWVRICSPVFHSGDDVFAFWLERLEVIDGGESFAGIESLITLESLVFVLLWMGWQSYCLE